MRIKVFLLVIVFFYSCNILKKASIDNSYKRGGLFMCVNQGELFRFYNDTNKAVMIDTQAIVPVSSILKMEKRPFDFGKDYNNIYIEVDSVAAISLFLATSNNKQKTIALILNNKLYVAPTINGTVDKGKILISMVDKKTTKIILKEFRRLKRKN